MKFLQAFTFLLLLTVAATAQDLTRELKLNEGSTLEIVNKFGRVAVKAEAGTEEISVTPKLTATSPGGVLEKEVKVVGNNITVTTTDKSKRIDLAVTVPENTKVKIETVAGAIEIAGKFAEAEAKTDTGTIITDVPDEGLKYNFLWTEARPRILADFDIAEMKEKSAGRFEIKGRRKVEEEKRGKGDEEKEAETRPVGSVPSPEENDGKDPKPKTKSPKPISLNFTTARGIILLNVPPSEVMSDLRERPLTEAAKAIIRSGDSLLMEAIRRASPKYFGDYARTLPPLKREPSFAVKVAEVEMPAAELKTATVRVTDLNNRSVVGLNAQDFEVIENGATREMVSVGQSQASFNLVLLLDVSGSIENYVNFIRKAARNFVDTVDARDRVSIVTFNEDVKKLSGFTIDKEKLSASLDTFDAGGGTAYYDALAYTIADTLRPLKGERTAVVILTDGDDNRSFLAFESLIGSIQESGALLYPLYVPSALIAAAETNQTIDPMRAKYMSLSAKSSGEGERLAKISGGVYYPITQLSQIQRAYQDIVLQMRSAYTITFRSGTPGGNTPKLKIRSKRENTFAVVTEVKSSL